MIQPLTPPRVLALLALPIAVLQLQHHSIAFWTQLTTGAEPRWSDLAFWLSPWRGWGWSVALEMAALLGWSRWRKAGFFLLGLGCSVLLLYGPLEQVAERLNQQRMETPVATAASHTAVLVEAAKQRLQDARQHKTTTEQRWVHPNQSQTMQNTIDAAHLALQALLRQQSEQQTAIQSGKAAAQHHRHTRNTIMYALALVMMQIIAALSVAILFDTAAPFTNPVNAVNAEVNRLQDVDSHGSTPPPLTVYQPPVNTLALPVNTPVNSVNPSECFPKERINTIQQQITDRLATGISQNALAEQLSIPAGNLSMARNHWHLDNEGQKTLGKDAWTTLETALKYPTMPA